jgi:hypothetical protein
MLDAGTGQVFFKDAEYGGTISLSQVIATASSGTALFG